MAKIDNLDATLSGDDLFWVIKHFLLAKGKTKCVINKIEIKKGKIYVSGNYPVKKFFLSSISFKCAISGITALHNNVIGKLEILKPLIVKGGLKTKILTTLKEKVSKCNFLHFNNDKIIFDISALSRKLSFVDLKINEATIYGENLKIALSNSSITMEKLK